MCWLVVLLFMEIFCEIRGNCLGSCKLIGKNRIKKKTKTTIVLFQLSSLN